MQIRLTQSIESTLNDLNLNFLLVNFHKKGRHFSVQKMAKKIKNQLFLKSFKIILLTIALMDLEKTIISSEFRPYFHEFHAV